jgi:hypothetical protein
VSTSIKPSVAKVQRSAPQTQAQGWTTRNIDTFRNDGYHFSLAYPVSFFEAGHEPLAGSNSCEHSYITECPPVNDAIMSHAGLPEISGKKVVINGTDYCHYELVDVAAGSRYYSDYYWTMRNKTCSNIVLKTSEQNCDNYLPILPGDEEQEKQYDNCTLKNKKRLTILQQIVSTLTFAK